MNAEEFVSALRLAVRDSAIDATLTASANPPGRNPSQKSLRVSEWYRSLGEEERSNLTSVITDAVDSTVFGFLCVLDGVRAVENGEHKGRLELRYVGSSTNVLNAPDAPMLHDIYNFPLEE